MLGNALTCNNNELPGLIYARMVGNGNPDFAGIITAGQWPAVAAHPPPVSLVAGMHATGGRTSLFLYWSHKSAGQRLFCDQNRLTNAIYPPNPLSSKHLGSFPQTRLVFVEIGRVVNYTFRFEIDFSWGSVTRPPSRLSMVGFGKAMPGRVL